MNIRIFRNRIAPSCLALAILATSPACHRSQAQPSAPAASTAAPAKKLTRIVFVGKEHPCECTRKALDAGWTALQKALGTPNRIPVERLQVDTEAAKVARFFIFGL